MPPCPSGVGAFAAFSSRSLTILQIAESSAHTPPVCAHRRFVTRSFAPFGRVTPQSDPGGRRAMDDAREARAGSPFLNPRSDESRVGKQGVSTCTSRWTLYHKKKKAKIS